MASMGSDSSGGQFRLMADFYALLSQHGEDSVGDLERAVYAWILSQTRPAGEPCKLSLWVVDQDSYHLRPRASWGMNEHDFWSFEDVRIEHLDVVLKTGESLTVAHFPKHPNPRTRGWAESEGVQTGWFFPIAFRGRTVGTLSVFWPDDRVMSEDDRAYWHDVTDSIFIFVAILWTRRRQQQHRLAVGEIMEMAGVAVIGFWLNTEIAYYNAALLELFHISAHDLHQSHQRGISRVAGAFVRPEEFLHAAEMIRESPGETHSFEMELKGSILPRLVRWQARPMIIDGEMSGVLCSFQDITREMEPTLRQQTFLSLVAHEFRTPITVVHGISDWMLRQGTDDPVLREQFQLIARESIRMMRLMREIWAAAHVEDPRWEFPEESLDLVEVVRTEMAYRHEASPLRDWTYRGPEEASVSVNREAITTVISVLLSNAQRFSAVAEPVLVEVLVEDQFVCLDVWDRGAGVPEAIRSTLFTAIPDVEKRSAVGGIGIGLWASAQLLARLRGDIHYEPRPDGGSRFTVRLPLCGSATPLPMRRGDPA